MILMKGHPGSGKTSIARCLSELMRMPLIDKDDARDCLTSLQGINTPGKVRKSPTEPSTDWLVGIAPAHLDVSDEKISITHLYNNGAITLLKTLIIDCFWEKLIFYTARLGSQVDLNVLSYEIMWRYAETQLLCRNSVIVDCPLARKELFQQGKHLASQACFCSHVSRSLYY